MLRLRDIMTRDVAVLSPDASIQHAMAFLVSQHISGAPVVSGTQVVGVVSATDLLEFASELPGLETEQPESVEEIELPDDATENAEPPGAFFHELWSDVAGMNERMSGVEGLEWNALAEHVVAEAMNHAVFALPPDTPVEHAAEYMRGQGVHRVLVMKGEKLVGIVSTSDIADAVADHKLTVHTYVFGR